MAAAYSSISPCNVKHCMRQYRRVAFFFSRQSQADQRKPFFCITCRFGITLDIQASSVLTTAVASWKRPRMLTTFSTICHWLRVSETGRSSSAAYKVMASFCSSKHLRMKKFYSSTLVHLELMRVLETPFPPVLLLDKPLQWKSA